MGVVKEVMEVQEVVFTSTSRLLLPAPPISQTAPPIFQPAPHN